MLEELLDPALARARRHNRCVALLFMDLDDFKTVNDVLGHDVGDLLLKQVGSRLSRVVRETDVLARQGGDEFLVMIPDLQPEEGFDDAGGALRVAEAMAERIHAVMRTPFQLGEREVNTSASIGISIFPTDAPDARALLKNSDAAMYDSKKTRHGGYSVYAESEGDPLTRLSFTHRLREAVRNERWALHYQPMVALADGTIAGVEALLRWRRPKGDLISPSEFLPLAEELGLLEAIGEWVLEELCRQAGAWRDAGLEIPVSFNLSPRQLWQPDLASKLSSTLDAAGIDPSRVIVEISESTAATDPARTQRVLWALHEAGLQLAIDDFGTGYSPPARLKHLPVDILKIDQPLVRDLPDDPEIGGFVQAVIGFAEGLDIRSLAEGIEADAQRRYLADKGCTLGQGYLFSRPVPGADVLELARRGGGVLSSS
jgi:diguanylate cyclase (GGDEF)-like protein